MSHHHPPHLYLDDAWYVITSATVGHAPFLATEQAKIIVRDAVRTQVRKFSITLRAWVILNDHYHLLLKTARGDDLTRFLSQLHGGTSRQINLLQEAVGRQIWHNYWDTCIRAEADLWARFNYIHNNPVKHGCARAADGWPFSSYHFYLRTKGEAWLQDCWERYPVIDCVEGDEFPVVRSG